ncbi:MAG TPA: quinoprotein relay system zinc metallohydrolase 2 [Casimicrobiaceae bacterium]|nr:quinoprotein relay system zinc metallohydrolase 2 [Casimicrobiaceae bacterium]
MITRHTYRRRIALVLAGITLAWALVATGARPEMSEFALENPAPGVYVHYGQQAAMSRANLGDIANLGFVVGARCVAVIDTGGTYAVGRALRQAIRRVTAVPVCYVINTHGHPDHVFGNPAFAEDRPEFIGHARLADALLRRGPNYLNALKRDLGDVANQSGVVLPTRSVASTAELDLGGRILSLRAWKTAHTDNDLTAFDQASRTLWLGDLLFVGHVPVVDGNLRGFLAALEEVKTLRANLVIPGHGRALAWPEAMAAEERYLRRLLDDVRAAIKAKRTLAETLASVDEGREQWLLFDQFHKRNVSTAYAELEWDE